jgi:hypothetical protein
LAEDSGQHLLLLVLLRDPGGNLSRQCQRRFSQLVRLLWVGSGEEGLGEDLRQRLQGHSARLLLAGSGVRLLLALGEG